MKDIATKTIAICQAFLDDEIDAKQFRSSLMTLAFTAAGVSNDEMEAFNMALQALYKMKGIGWSDVLGVFREVKGRKQDIVKILENKPVRRIPDVDPKTLENPE